MRIENSVTRDNCSASLDKPHDAEQLQGIFNLHLSTIKDSYILPLEQAGGVNSVVFSIDQDVLRLDISSNLRCSSVTRFGHKYVINTFVKRTPGLYLDYIRLINKIPRRWRDMINEDSRKNVHIGTMCK